EVTVTSNRHKSSRSPSCGNRPRAAWWQKLAKALRATSSSSAARRGASWSFFRAKPTKRRKYRSQSFWAAAESPAWSWPIQFVTESSDDIEYRASCGSFFEGCSDHKAYGTDPQAMMHDRKIHRSLAGFSRMQSAAGRTI